LRRLGPTNRFSWTHGPAGHSCLSLGKVLIAGHSRIVDTLSHFAKIWRHASYSWGGLLVLAEELEQQCCELPP